MQLSTLGQADGEEQRAQDEEGQRHVGSVEVSLLHVRDHQRDEGCRQQADTLPVDPPAQREGQRHRAQVKKRCQRPPHQERVGVVE